MPSSSTVTTKSSDSGLRALLHPLILLTISDYITRHTLRRQTQPIVGVLLGQQNGREISLEYAYEVKLLQDVSSSKEWILDADWFSERLQQYKDVHKDPALDLVGWWTTAPEVGPGREVLGIHEAIMTYNESALLLAFHPSTVLEGDGVGGKLPLSVYESVYESNRGDSSREMQIDGEEPGDCLELKFRELPYEVATAEAEMISVDFVARGGGSATAVDTSAKNKGKDQASQKTANGKPEAYGKGKERAKELKSAKTEDASGLTAEDEEFIASLTTRANATKMLQSRLSLLKSYLEALPPSYLTQSSSEPSSIPADPNHTELSHPLLRAILALTSRLPLLIPADNSSFQKEFQAEKSDVSLVALLGSLGQNIKEVKGLGTKFGIVEQARAGSRKNAFGSTPMGMGIVGVEADGVGMEPQGAGQRNEEAVW